MLHKLNRGWDPNVQNDYGDSAILAAVERNNIKMVKILLEAGATLDTHDIAGFTPLMVAESDEMISLIKSQVNLSNRIE